jgi:hypothetical protein
MDGDGQNGIAMPQWKIAVQDETRVYRPALPHLFRPISGRAIHLAGSRIRTS